MVPACRKEACVAPLISHVKENTSLAYVMETIKDSAVSLPMESLSRHSTDPWVLTPLPGPPGVLFQESPKF